VVTELKKRISEGESGAIIVSSGMVPHGRSHDE